MFCSWLNAQCFVKANVADLTIVWLFAAWCAKTTRRQAVIRNLPVKESMLNRVDTADFYDYKS